MKKIILPEPTPGRLRVLEGIIAGALFITLYVLLFRFAGGPVKSDEVMYINNGLMNIKDTFIINRYTHIYFQKLFMELASNPFIGVKSYWAFLIAGSTALIYLISRLATRSSSVIHAGLSVLLYLSIPLIAANSGNTAVDITAGFFLTLAVSVYILYYRLPKKRPILLILFGFFFFLAFRSKETTLALVVLFGGLLFDETGSINWRTFLKKFLFVLIGIFAGIVLFIILNGIFLKDPWFGLRISEYLRFKESYVDRNIAEDAKVSVNWLTDYLFKGILFIFVAFLLSGARVIGDLEKPLRVPWIVPLIFVGILSAIIGFSKWGVVERHIFPALPLICAFAPQLIVHDRAEKKKDYLWLGISIVLTLVLLVAGRWLLMKASLQGPYNYPQYLSSSIYPILTLVLIGLAFLIKRYSFKTILFPLLIFFALIRYPLTVNAEAYFIQTPNVNKMAERLQVFRAFKEEYTIRDPQKILLFEGALYRLNYSSRYAEYIGLYNMYFDARLETKNVDMTSTAKFTPGMLLDEMPDYVLMTADERSLLEKSPESLAILERNYQEFTSKNGEFLLFVKADK